MSDEVSGCSFLVDTGADISVFPASIEEKRSPASALSNLVAANGSTIALFGSKSLKLSFPSVNLVHRFRIADVSKPILGSDFFARTGLLVDIKNR